MERDYWIIWSNEHGGFWRTNGWGYTQLVESAGVYGRAQAQRICHDGNHWQPPGATPNEVMLRAPSLGMHAGNDTETILRSAGNLLADCLGGLDRGAWSRALAAAAEDEDREKVLTTLASLIAEAQKPTPRRR